MAALSLHHALFANEKDSTLPLRSASSFLRPALERDGSSTKQLLSSVAYQDLIQRQPTHPDGPTTGWDLGLNLLGDPMTAAEHKSLQVHQIKVKLRRLHAISIAFELLFGIWGTYTTVRYCLAFADCSRDTEHVCPLILGIISALAVALVITSVLTPLFPQKSHLTWRYARLLLRACYLVLLAVCAIMNLILVLMQHPTEFCGWDIDISWYTTPASTLTSPCHAVAFAVWITAAILRLLVTLAMVAAFVYVLRSYHGTRYPTSEDNGPKYTPYLTSDPEELSPVSASSPFDRSKSMSKFTRSEDSNHTLNRSSVTLPKSSSISTLALSTGHSRSHSTLPSKDISPPRISPPTSRRTSSTHATHHHGPLPTLSQSPFQSSGSEIPLSQIQRPVSVVAVPSPTSHMLRRTSRISVTQIAPSLDATSDIASSRSERLSSPTIGRDSSEIQSSAPWKPSHRGTGVHLDASKKVTPLARENDNVHSRHSSQASGTFSEALPSAREDGQSIQEREKDKGGDGVLVYDYGYGASGHTYPYLDMYNPQGPREPAEAASPSLPEDMDPRGLSQGHRRVIPCGLGVPDAPSSEPRPLLSRDDAVLAKDEGSDQDQSSAEEAEEEYVAMMGGFVRRMATIESLGSREAAGTLSSSKTGPVAFHKTVASSSLSSASSQFSSVRFAATHGSLGTGSGLGFGFGSSSRSRSGTSSFGALITPSSSSKHTGSLSTTYLSFSSNGTDAMQVNERGELLPQGSRNTSSSSLAPHDRHHGHSYTTSGNSLPRMDDCDEDR